jgi:PAS domain S-box-containing protein
LRLVWLILCGVLTLALCAAGASASEGTKRVVLLFESESNLPASIIMESSIRDTLRPQYPESLTVYSEYLDLDRFPGPAHEKSAAAYLGEKYSHTGIDVAIAVGPRALDFILKRRASLFKGASLLFITIGALDTVGPSLPADVFGFTIHTDLAPTVDMALRLQPGAKRLVVVSGDSVQDRAWEARARSELSTYKDRLELNFLSGSPMAELLHQVSLLPRDAIVLYLTIYKDGAGQLFRPLDAAKMLTDASSAPVYGVYDTLLPMGIVGGRMDTFAAIGRRAGELAGHILAGERLTNDHLSSVDTSAYYVNWLQLQRWQLDEAQLPAGTIVRFRDPSLWVQYHRRIIAASGLVVIQSLLLLALLIQARRRRRAEQAVRESEARMALAAESTNLGLWRWDAASREFWTANIFGSIIELAAGENPGFESFLARIHPDDRPLARHGFEEAMKSGELHQTEFRLLSADGAVRWIAAAGRLTQGPAGKKARLTGIVTDITRRKLAEAEVADQRAQLAHLTRVAMLGELSGALAHELGQPLTAILSNAQAAQRFLAKETPDVAEVRSIIADIIFDDMRAGEMIQQLRSLFKKHEIEFELVDLNQTVAEVEKIVHSELIARNVRLITRLSPHLAQIRGHHVQLQQVYLNLIVNACDALQNQKADDRTLTICTGPNQNGEVQISFEDSGPGVAPEMLGNLFDPFVTSKQLGLGLGLSVCQSIIGAHGGRLWASNNRGRGATFWIALPATSGVDR